MATFKKNTICKKDLLRTPKNQNKTTLSCLSHVKRLADPETGVIKRPVCPGLYSDTCFLGDNSGSMSSMGRSPEDGARLFAEQYHALGVANSGQTPTYLAFAVFSTTCEEVYADDPAKLTQKQIDLCAHSMRPTNLTRFYDSAIEQLAAQAKRIRASYATLSPAVRRLVPLDQYAAVVFATLTDGQDNMSNLCDGPALKRAFNRHKVEFGAKILFIAANMSAEDVGKNYGIDEDACLQMGSDQLHSQEAFKAVTSACMREASCGAPQYRSATIPNRQTFTGLERMSSCSVGEAQLYGAPPQYSAPGTKDNSGQPDLHLSHFGGHGLTRAGGLRRQNAMNSPFGV